MKRLLLIAFSLLLSVSAVDISAQSLLQRLGKAIEKEVKKEVDKNQNKKSQSKPTDKKSKTTTTASTPKTREIITNSEETIESKSPITGKLNGYEWVDLGLPSGTRWATCNIGATASVRPGKLYAWGETSTKSSYTEANSKNKGKDLGDISGKRAYDVATASWGQGWRMPTEEEFSELLNYCSYEYVQQGGRWGQKFTSNKNKNSIFIPVTGYKDGSSIHDASGNGMYWTSSSGPSSDCAYFYQFGAAEGYMGWGNCYSGFAVRAVCDKVSSVNSPVSGMTNDHEWVDLGLPSGLKWATCNLGAKIPEQNGKHYAWGETTPITDRNSRKNKMYGTKSDDISGNLHYDAANAVWGGTWRIPTQEEFQELIDNCTWKWVVIDGRKGYKVISKKNNNFIFLPSAGVFHSSTSELPGDIDKYAGYWASTPGDESYSHKAFGLTFGQDYLRLSGSSRYFGYTIRPVTK